MWYYSSLGRRIGPISEDELRGLVSDGKIASDTLVWSDGMPDWVPIKGSIFAQLFPDPQTNFEQTPLSIEPDGSTAVSPDKDTRPESKFGSLVSIGVAILLIACLRVFGEQLFGGLFQSDSRPVTMAQVEEMFEETLPEAWAGFEKMKTLAPQEYDAFINGFLEVLNSDVPENEIRQRAAAAANQFVTNRWAVMALASDRTLHHLVEIESQIIGYLLEEDPAACVAFMDGDHGYFGRNTADERLQPLLVKNLKWRLTAIAEGSGQPVKRSSLSDSRTNALLEGAATKMVETAPWVFEVPESQWTPYQQCLIYGLGVDFLMQQPPAEAAAFYAASMQELQGQTGR